MPPQSQANEQLAEMPFPVSGVDVSVALHEQTPGTTPVGVNVRTYEPSSLRGRGGSRPGVGKYIADQLPPGAHLIQNLNTVDPTDSGGLLDWGYSWPLATPAPDGFFLDTTDAGPSSLWGATTVAFGINSRNPGRVIPAGGSGVQPNKNTARTLKVPTITWADPAPVSSGTALSGTQLNATAADPVTSAAVPGTFDYTPPAGTVLPDGSNSLSVRFTPSDPKTYTLNTKTVSLTVGSPLLIQWQAVLGSSVAFDSAVGAGSLLLAYTVEDGSGGSVSGVTDGLGNAFSLVGSATKDVYSGMGLGDGTVRTSLWYAVSSAGADTVTAHWTATPGHPLLVIAEFAPQSSSPLEVHTTNTGTVAGGPGTASTGGMAVASVGDLVFGAITYGGVGATGSAPAGYFSQHAGSTPTAGGQSAYVDLAWKKAAASPASADITLTPLVSDDVQWVMIGAVFAKA